MADFLRKMFGTKKSEPEKQPTQVDMATTAPLSDQQISSIIGSQNSKYEMKQLESMIND